MKKLIILTSLSLLFLTSCNFPEKEQQKSDSGVTKASVKVKTNSEGFTVEQENYIARTKRDNEIGAVKHLYIVSSFTGDIMEYSTVRGKVTSGGKRLSPRTVFSGYGTSESINTVKIGGKDFETPEVMDEYGMYGDSMPYIYWIDAQGEYQQYFPSGGTYLRISESPLVIKKSNLSLTAN